jgi:hypothetical protein
MRHTLAGCAKLPTTTMSIFLLWQCVVGTPAFASAWIQELRRSPGVLEIRLNGMNSPENTLNTAGPYMVLRCERNAVSVVMNWREPVGTLGERRRHIFYHADGDSHLLMPVVEASGESTGYVNKSDKAKSLIREILVTLNRDFIPIGVFPAGADPATGEWINAWLPAEAFKQAVAAIGIACKFDPIKAHPNGHAVDKIPPAPPGGS